MNNDNNRPGNGSRKDRRGDRRNKGTRKPVNNGNSNNNKGAHSKSIDGHNKPNNDPHVRQSNSKNNENRPFRHIKHPIGYVHLKETITTMEHSKLLLELSSETFGFLTLLEESNIKPGMMCLILNTFAKVIDSPTDGDCRKMLLYFLHKILPKTKDATHFMKTALPIFIMNLTTYTSINYHERESYIQAIFDLLKFIRKLQMILPQASRDIIRGLTPGLQAQIEFINRKGNYCFSDETMELLTEVTESMNNLNPTDEVIQIVETVGEPPEDFRLIQVCPNADDILYNHEPYIRRNVVNGKYIGGVDHYLDVQFRLLREDFVRPLREGITEYLRLSQDKTRKHNLNKIKDVKVYNEVYVVNSIMRSGDLIYGAIFNTTEFKKVRWQFSKRLLTGSLICLTPDEFKTFCFATVTGRRDPDKLAKGEFQLKFEFENHVTNNISPVVPLKMIESQVYFEAYRHNLQVLQNFHAETFPFKRYIIDVNCDILPPPYLRNTTKYNLSDLTQKLFSITADQINAILNDPLEMHDMKSAQQRIKAICAKKPEGERVVAQRCRAVTVLNDQLWPDRNDFGLDESQFVALKAALTKDFVIIQGPPGTGKTYVGLRIAQALLQNIPVWGYCYSTLTGTTSKVSPILIVCYTNHALDQFLEGILPFCQNMIRIGAKSRSPLLEQFNLKNVKMIQQEKRQIPSYIHRSRMDSRRTMEEIQSKLSELEKAIDTTTKELLFDKLLVTINKLHHYQLLHSDGSNLISQWLGNMAENGYSAPSNTFDDMDLDSDDEEFIDNNDDESELDGDQEEIMEIENNRIIDGEFDDEIDPKTVSSMLPSNANISSRRLNNYWPVEMTDGFQLQRHQKKRMKYRFKQELKKTDEMTIVEANSVKNIWELSSQQRWNLYRFWRKSYVQKIEKEIQEHRKRYAAEWVRFEALRKQEDLEIVNGHSIIGMTTTGAAKYHHIIDGIQPRIIIVEEAAEVLEAHIVTSLCSKTDHLILIGDHQQLKPNPAVYELAKKFKLEVSLFERMIQNGIACYQLKLQHRMRPNISELLVPHIYKELMDHDSVKFYEDIKGVSCNMYFVNHGVMESKVNDTMSRKNDYEAYFAVELCRYLILQGYQISQVTILTMYSGQLYQIKSLMKKHEILKGVCATVVDNFQGEESDIIILTFVRSNMDGEIGFLKVSNRVNVALSRAKKGLYCIGNFDCLLKDSPLWQKIIQKLKQQNAIGFALDLYCQNHSETITSVAKGEDFAQCPEGGCLKPCDARLACGHACPSACHIFDSEHELTKCSKPCDKIVCEKQHRCKKKCHYGKECNSCVVKVPKKLPACGHLMNVKCSESPLNVFCTAPCEKLRSCGHKCQLNCGNNCESNPCQSVVEKKVKCNHKVKVKCSDSENEAVLFMSCKSPCNTELDCGHICLGTCGLCYRGRLHVKCKAKCNRPLICGHLCKDKCATNCPPCTQLCPNLCPHSKCKLKCGTPCVPCQEPCDWVCEHKQCTKLCKENCDRDLCIQACKNILKCNHPCIGVCGEPCPKLCRICDKDEVQEIFFGDEDEPDARFILLMDCQHVIEVNGLLNWMKKEENGTESANMSIQMKACPKCKTVVRQTKALNTFIQSCLRDLEGVKLQTFGNADNNRKEQTALYNTVTSSILRDVGVWSEFKHTAVKHLRSIHNKLLADSKPVGKGIVPSKFDICMQQNIYQIWTNIFGALKTYSDARKGNHKNIVQSVFEQLELRAFHLLSFMENFTNNQQEMEDVKREVKFLQISSSVAKNVNTYVFNEQGCAILRSAFELILSCGRFTDTIQNNFKKMIDEASKQQSGIGVTLEEKNMILTAMGFSKGHWYKCPNGHIYCIADCGGAVTESICPECGSTIGGASHRLRSDNAIATEMDGAREPAWPTNLINELQPFM